MTGAGARAATSGRLVLLRHGQTDHNVAGRLQGRVDVPLNDTGRAQARAAARSLAAGATPDLVVSSPLSRALETAEIIAATLGVPEPIVTEKALIEAGFGAWEGLTDAEIAERWPDDHRQWRQRGPLAHIGMEDRGVVGDRVAGACRALLAQHPGAQILVVSHGAALRSGITSLLGLDAAQFHGIGGLENCCSSVLEPLRSDPDGRLMRLQSHNRPPDFAAHE